jgi:hypothetical protein
MLRSFTTALTGMFSGSKPSKTEVVEEKKCPCGVDGHALNCLEHPENRATIYGTPEYYLKKYIDVKHKARAFSDWKELDQFVETLANDKAIIKSIPLSMWNNWK